ncbi:MAG: thiamine biosynthesis lipoprotein [Glaciecola sp.]
MALTFNQGKPPYPDLLVSDQYQANSPQLGVAIETESHLYNAPKRDFMRLFILNLTLAALAGGPQGLLKAQEAPKRHPHSLSRQGTVMGAPWQLTLGAQDRAAALIASETLVQALTEAELRLSNWNPNSELSRWNQGRPGHALPCSPILANEVARADHWRPITLGAFSPFSEPLVRAWDLRGAGRIPNPQELTSALEACNSEGLTWQDGQPIRAEQTQVASGGFGKGAALDFALAKLSLDDSHSVALNLGGQIIVRGLSQRIEIAHPEHRTESIAHWVISEGSLATSGNSERSKTVGDTKFGHILDARTGQPALDFGSVTIWCDNALDADCLSTAFFALGPDEGLRVAATLPDVRVLFVENNDGQLTLRATKNCQPFLSSTQTILWHFEPQALTSPIDFSKD